MASAEVIGRLFANILHDDIRQNHINDAAIRTGIQNMRDVYLPDPNSLTSGTLDVANYNDIAHRCAYLHKYAPFHVSLVADMFSKAMDQQHVRNAIMKFFSSHGCLNLCSLGGGPGSDVFGVLSVLVSHFGFFQVSATIIDCMIDWNLTFTALVNELRREEYGDLGDIVQSQYFDWDYIGHNLLAKMSNDVNRAIQGSDMITMVKFVSAAACKDTPQMLTKIFNSLKQGAVVLYIDNAGGGFHQIIQKCAHQCKMLTLFGPLKHQNYSNKSYNVKKFGYTPCLETTVSFHMWRKAGDSERIDNDSYFMGSQPVTPQILNARVNQYNINNTNVYVHNQNQANWTQNRQNNQRGRSRSRSRSNNRNRSNRRQGQRQIANEEDENDVQCCVIL